MSLPASGRDPRDTISRVITAGVHFLQRQLLHHINTSVLSIGTVTMSSQAYYELYRGSSIGLSLTDTLDDLINEGRIEPQLAMKILSTFDRVITEVLADKVQVKLSFKGHLDTYRFCDEVWTFLIKDVNFKLDNQSTVFADKVKIVSCNSKRPGEV